MTTEPSAEKHKERSGMLEGLPDLGRYLCNLVSARKQRGPLGVVVYHHLGDLVHAARHALIHYFPLDLTESFLQGSSIGTPYQKWAYFTNEDFQQVDECLRRLLVAGFRYYADTHDPLTSRGALPNAKDAWHWFQNVATKYACCTVDDAEPRLTLSGINMRGWAEQGATDFLKVWNVAPSERGDGDPPPIVTTTVVSIRDRAAIGRLSKDGLGRLAELRRAHDTLAEELRASLTMDEVTAPHKGSLSEHWIGIVTAPGVRAGRLPKASSE